MFDMESRLQRVREVLARPPTQHEVKTMAAKKNAAAPAPKANASGGEATSKEKKEADPNSVPLAVLCKELKITGQHARRKLRAAKLQRDGRWAWQKGSKELAQVREILTAEPAEA